MGSMPADQGLGQAGWILVTLCTQNSKAAARLQFHAAMVHRFLEAEPAQVALGSLHMSSVININLLPCSPGIPSKAEINSKPP